MPSPLSLPEPTAVAIAKAKWIWTAAPQRPYHNFTRFRKTFSSAGPSPQDATLHITADARYELYLDNQYLGSGPPRSWITPWPLDTYTVPLPPGDHTLEVLVHSPGLSTFQYLNAPPGLLAALVTADITVVTDESWTCVPDTRFAFPVPRISCQQPWEEQFTATADPLDYQPAVIVTSPHTELEPRAVPQLTRNAAFPVRLLETALVTSADFTWNINPRDRINAEDKSANHINARFLIATYLHADAAQTARFHNPHNRPHVEWKLNGTPLNFSDHPLLTDTGVASAELKPGYNLLLGRLPESEHYAWSVLNLWAKNVTFSARPEKCDGPQWLGIGPFAGAQKPKGAPAGTDKHRVEPLHIDPAATDEAFNRIWSTGLLTPADLAAPFTDQLPARSIATTDIYATCASETPIPELQPHLDNPSALLSDNSDWTTLHPSPDGDPRILLDFGHELIGHHCLEIDDPTGGTHIDNHNFEFIQPDGRHNLAEGMNNSFRYTTRPGLQTYTTHIRRGFRYSWFTFRNLKSPLRIRSIKVLTSTYPQQRIGSFSCSDALLNEIWAAGVRSVECCSEDAYTDCPTYEQTLWVGDARNEALVDLIANGDPRLSARCLLVAARSLDRSPLVESHVPSGWENLLPAWSFLWMRWVAEHYHLTGDTALANTLLPYVEKNIAGIRAHLSPKGLFSFRGWNMFDWAHLDTPPEGEVTHLNCLAILGLRQCATLATQLARSDLATTWTTLADTLKQAVNTHLWDDGKQAYIDSIHADGVRSTTFSQQTHTAAHIANVATDDRKARVRDLMLHPPKGFVTAGSPFFMFFLLEAQAGENDIAGMLNSIRDYWGIQIQQGATTFWEMYYRDQKRMTRSHCHGWSAAPTYFLYTYALGLQVLDPGFKTIKITPPTNTALSFAQATLPTPHGPLSLRWELKNNIPTLTQTAIPPGITVVS